jgi:hypothetical protein
VHWLVIIDSGAVSTCFEYLIDCIHIDKRPMASFYVQQLEPIIGKNKH